jgi:hypothetical protein
MRKYYVGLDVHKATIAVAVPGACGEVASQSVIEASPRAVRDHSHGLRGELHVTFKGGNHAALAL